MYKTLILLGFVTTQVVLPFSIYYQSKRNRNRRIDITDRTFSLKKKWKLPQSGRQNTNLESTASKTTESDVIYNSSNPMPRMTTASLPRNILGPPEPICSLRIREKLRAFRKLDNTDDGNRINQMLNFTIERVSYAPDAFVMRNVLTSEECRQIQTMAYQSNMTQAETITKNNTSSRKYCNVSWVPSTGPNKSNLVSSLVSSAANLFLSKSVLSHPSAGVEDLQILKYGAGGEFVLHHDGEPRIMTIIYYVNGIGGTWFPLARTSDDPCHDMNSSQIQEEFNRCREVKSPQNKAQALDLGNGLEPGSSGLLVKGASEKTKPIIDEDNEHVAWIDQGDALVFYNYCDDGSAKLDWRSIHSGLPTSEVKWIANHWFRINDLLWM